MKKFEKIALAALESGAAKATVVDTDQIVLSAQFREICAGNQCGNYGRCWMCPPDIAPVEELMARVQRYPYALIYQSIGKLEDSFDIEGMTAAAGNHARLSQRIQSALEGLMEDNWMHLSCGGCHLCERCAKRDGEPCRKPREALTSLEAAGVDVYNSVKDTPLKYINGRNTVTYFGMVFFEEKRDA